MLSIAVAKLAPTTKTANPNTRMAFLSKRSQRMPATRHAGIPMSDGPVKVKLMIASGASAKAM